jgi:hypothetical protein
MSFSDNLENNLKSLEAQEERDPEAILRARDRAEQQRQDRLQAAPFAEQLRTGAFTQKLLEHATRIGFSKRAKVYITWLDSTLRMDAKHLRLELRPTGRGIAAHYFENGAEARDEMVDLNSDPAELASRWLAGLG